ncbi:hypothetical protein [Rathayibacter sp. VKM Ac-2754]|uniref:hypothetical protein n=1 Tax=Rathayibacter sp. VKM Ac-2754 TaxID=2609251 RepID=UPI0014011BFA|nr:hypothetical protein [Rathayibacter sp. VKM Ac-2754]MWV60593.1 hypothetical protein [Rathayibacter sp. VKM Ac-2754]
MLSGALLGGVVAGGIASAIDSSFHTSALAPSAAGSQRVVDLGEFGAVPDGVTDLGPAISEALDSLGGASCILSLPVGSPTAGRYYLATDVTLDRPGVSLDGNGMTVVVAAGAALHVGRRDEPMVWGGRISGINWLREGTSDGSAIPAGSRFVVFERVRNAVVSNCSFNGSDIGVAFPSNPSGGQHDTAFIYIVGCSFSEVNFAVKGDVDVDAPGRWAVVGEVFVLDALINRAYVSGIHFDGVDGLMITRTDFVNLGSGSVTHSRIADKRNNVFIGQCDWVQIVDNQMYEAGREAVRVDAARQVKIEGNMIAWPGQLELCDAVRVTGYADYDTRLLVASNIIVFYTKSAVSVSGKMGSVVVGPNSTSFDVNNSRYIGPRVGTAVSTLSSESHYRYDFGAVSGIDASELQVVGEATFRSGEFDRLPRHSSTVAISKETSSVGRSAAITTVYLSGPIPVFDLSALTAGSPSFGGLVLISVRSGSTGGGSGAFYLVMLAGSPAACTVVSETGATAEGELGIDWSVDGSSLVAMARGGVAGPISISAQSIGDLVIG